MVMGPTSDGWNDLVEELKQLEAYFPLLGSESEREELDEEILELEQLIASAGEPEDEHSMRALTYLQTELARKRAMRDDHF
ncbi:MAG: hypothetical protein RLW61_09600 [Gammaproteobacteria bacterium]|jgi:hypothetical protein